MADSVVTFLLENLTQLLKQEVNLLLGVEDQVRSLHAELKLINIFLQNSEGKRNEHEMVKELVSQIREVAYEAEDVIDTFVVNVMKQRKRNKVGKFFRIGDHAAMLRSVATTIESIKQKIKEIYDNRDKYGIEMSERGRDAELESSLYRLRTDVEEDNVVGFDGEAKSLVKQLIEGESERDVISIIGMGGLGKTTLAKKVYNDISVGNHFNCCAWVYVSQKYSIRELLLHILRCVMTTTEERGLVSFSRSLLQSVINPRTPWRVLLNSMSTIGITSSCVLRCYCHTTHHAKQYCKSSDGMSDIQEINDICDDDELKRMLSKCLNGRRYLIVMDDVWTTDLWDEVKASFPDNLNGSRIMITSRLKEVASHASLTQPHLIPFLNEADSWELFSKKVFRGRCCPPELKDLGKQMVKSCRGLPLSIVVFGGLLAKKEKTPRMWSKMVDHVGSYLSNEKQCLAILALSYDHLPRQLKSCFLYLGVFPGEFVIPARQLIQMWIAEGFIQKIGSRSMEDVAEEYLEELIDRSLVQVARKRTDGGVKTCCIHDLLRDLCISQSSRDKFLEVHLNVNSSSSSKPRRLSIHCNIPQYISSYSCNSSCMRSFLCFGDDENHLNHLSTGHWKLLYKRFVLVRVLDLGSVIVDNVPDKIEKLIHLRYLRMNAPSLNFFPPSLCNLWNLQTLDMRQTSVNWLPNGFWKMQQLRHLCLSGPIGLPVTLGTDNKAMSNLQTLCTVVPDTMHLLMVKALFPNITKLGICSSNKWRTKEFLGVLHHLHHLHTLKIIKSSLLPESPDSFPPSLTKITLLETHLSFQHMLVLGKLPNLRILKLLQGSFTGLKMDCSASGFPQLQVLKMVKLDTSLWELEEGTMQNLRHLVLVECVKLRELPGELWRLTNLRDVEVLAPSSELATRLLKIEMKKGRNIMIDSLPLRHG